MPANVAVFYQYAGAHEENAASQGLGTAGAKGVEQSNWCQQASSYAICEALLRNGLRFKSAPGRRARRSSARSRINEVAMQAGKYEAWLKGGGGTRTAWGGDTCWASALSPGDVFSFYSAAHGPTATGHVVTVVTGAGPGEETAITVVSGNAGGEAARVEEVQRVQPPQGLFSGSAKRPERLEAGLDLEPAAGEHPQRRDRDREREPAVRRTPTSRPPGWSGCKPLDEIWPAAEAVASTGVRRRGGGGGHGRRTGGAAARAGRRRCDAADGGGFHADAASGGRHARRADPEPTVPGPADAAGPGLRWRRLHLRRRPAPADPAPAGTADGGLGDWFASLWESAFGDSGSEQKRPRRTASSNRRQRRRLGLVLSLDGAQHAQAPAWRAARARRRSEWRRGESNPYLGRAKAACSRAHSAPGTPSSSGRVAGGDGGDRGGVDVAVSRTSGRSRRRARRRRPRRSPAGGRGPARRAPAGRPWSARAAPGGRPLRGRRRPERSPISARADEIATRPATRSGPAGAPRRRSHDKRSTSRSEGMRSNRSSARAVQCGA